MYETVDSDDKVGTMGSVNVHVCTARPLEVESITREIWTRIPLPVPLAAIGRRTSRRLYYLQGTGFESTDCGRYTLRTDT